MNKKEIDRPLKNQKILPIDVQFVVRYFQLLFGLSKENFRNIDFRKNVQGQYLELKHLINEIINRPEPFWKALSLFIHFIAVNQLDLNDLSLDSIKKIIDSDSVKKNTPENIKKNLEDLITLIQDFKAFDSEIVKLNLEQIYHRFRDSLYNLKYENINDKVKAGIPHDKKDLEWIDMVTSKKFLELETELVWDQRLGKDIDKFIEGSRVYVTTGLKKLDSLIKGFSSSLIVLAGRSASGKTWFAINFMVNVLKAGHYVLFFSIEMNYKDIILRFLSIILNKEFAYLDSMCADVDSSEYLEFKDLYSKHLYEPYIKTGKLEIFNEIIKDLNNIIPTIKRVRNSIKERDKLLFVVIDHLREIKSGNANVGDDQKWLFLESIMISLRGIISDSGYPNICIMPLSQVSRSATFRKADESFQPEDLSASSGLENTANVVIFIRQLKPSSLPGYDNCWLTEVNVAKNRRGPSGIFDVNFNKSIGSVSDDSELLIFLHKMNRNE